MREVRRGRTCDPRLSAQARVTRPARSVGRLTHFQEEWTVSTHDSGVGHRPG